MKDLVPGQDLSFEDALTQLEALVARLETGSLTLAEAISSYERGMGLAAYCTDLLDSAELRLREIDAATKEIPDYPLVSDTLAEANGEYSLEDEIDLLLQDEES